MSEHDIITDSQNIAIYITSNFEMFSTEAIAISSFVIFYVFNTV